MVPAGLAMALALVGLYGVLAFILGQRSREIGVRLALGASPWQIGAMITRQTGTQALLGVSLGASVYLAFSQVLSSLLFGVGPRDPVTLVVCALALSGASLAAGWTPMRRATYMNPGRRCASRRAASARPTVADQATAFAATSSRERRAPQSPSRCG